MSDSGKIQRGPRGNWNLKVYKKPAPESRLENLRNYHTVQGALFRGEKTVRLHNKSGVKFNRDIRYNHDSDRRDQAISLYEKYPLGGGRNTGGYRDNNAKDGIARREWEGFKLVFDKVLAVGGFGAAALWDVTFENGETHQVVIKRGIHDDLDAQDELTWHDRYQGNAHVVQPMHLHGFGELYRKQAREAWEADKGNKKEPIKFKGQIFDMVKLKVLVTEFAAHGDLYGILKEATRQRRNFPTKVLWEIWECFVKGLAAVAYQPTITKDFPGKKFEEMLKEVEASDGETLEQCLVDLENNFAITHDVHFDLEEHNILVSESVSHTHAPIFKLNDFGGDYSIRMDEAWEEWGEEGYWRARMCPKKHRLTPEQVHKTWDYLSSHPDNRGIRFSGSSFTEPKKRMIAGRYGSWTNVFHIADVMSSVMTKFYLSHPFIAKPHESSGDEKTPWTYAWRLMDPKYNHFDKELRDIICQCMYERPKDRPSIPTLLRQIYQRKARGFDMDDQESKDWWAHFFNPQAPPSIVESKMTVSEGGVMLNASTTEPNTAERIGQQLRQPIPPARPVAPGSQQAKQATSKKQIASEKPTKEPSFPDTASAPEQGRGHPRHLASQSPRNQQRVPERQRSPRPRERKPGQSRESKQSGRNPRKAIYPPFGAVGLNQQRALQTFKANRFGLLGNRPDLARYQPRRRRQSLDPKNRPLNQPGAAQAQPPDLIDQESGATAAFGQPRYLFPHQEGQPANSGSGLVDKQQRNVAQNDPLAVTNPVQHQPRNTQGLPPHPRNRLQYELPRTSAPVITNPAVILDEDEDVVMRSDTPSLHLSGSTGPYLVNPAAAPDEDVIMHSAGASVMPQSGNMDIDDNRNKSSKPYGSIMRAIAVPIDVSEDEDEDEKSEDDNREERTFSTNATSLPSNASLEDEEEVDHGQDWHSSERSSKKPRTHEPQGRPSFPLRHLSANVEESPRDLRREERVRPIRVEKSKAIKRTAKQEESRRKPGAQEVVEAAERNLSEMPMAIQNLVVRGRALEAYLGEDEPKKGKKRKNKNDVEEDRGRKRQRGG